jgi:hypothetical protein
MGNNEKKSRKYLREKRHWTAGAEHELHNVYWKYDPKFLKDHDVPFYSDYNDYSFETQGKAWSPKNDSGVIEAITRKQIVDKIGKERALAVIQNALVLWCFYYYKEYCEGTFKFFTKNIEVLKGVKVDLSRKIEVKDGKKRLRDLMNGSLYGCVKFYNQIIRQKGFEIRKRVQGLEGVPDFKRKMALSMNPKFIEVMKKTSIKGFSLSESQDKTRSLRTTQVTMTLDLGTVYYLFRDLKAHNMIPQSYMDDRKKQLEHCVQFADEAILLLAREVWDKAKTQHIRYLLDRSFSKVRGLLCLLFLQLHFGQEGGSDKLKFKDLMMPRTYKKDYVGLLLKTPLRALFLKALSPKDHHFMTISEAYRLLEENWIDIAKKLDLITVEKMNPFEELARERKRKRGEQLEPTLLEEQKARIKKYINHVFVPTTTSRNAANLYVERGKVVAPPPNEIRVVIKNKEAENLLLDLWGVKDGFTNIYQTQKIRGHGRDRQVLRVAFEFRQVDPSEKKTKDDKAKHKEDFLEQATFIYNNCFLAAYKSYDKLIAKYDEDHLHKRNTPYMLIRKQHKYTTIDKI